VLLAAHGEAETGRFLENYRISWHTLAHASEVMRLPLPLRILICSFAAFRKRLGRRSGSPHNAYTRQQAEALEARLNEDRHAAYRVEAVFASAPPYLDDSLDRPEDASRQVIVNMIPTDSRLSCGLGCHALQAAAAVEGSTVIARFWDDPDLIAVHCDHVIEHFPSELAGKNACLVLILHGTVVRDERGQTPDYHTGEREKTSYADALKAALLAVPDRPWQRVEIAYLNHGVGGEWSNPTLTTLLAQLAEEGLQTVVAYPCEHLVEGGETLGLGRVLAASGVAETHGLPCLNDRPDLIELLARRVIDAAESEADRWLCDACPLRSAAQ
jgi:ferrochelatase